MVSKGVATREASKKSGRFAISRRGFIKLTAITGAVVAAGSLIQRSILSPVKAFWDDTGRTLEEKWVPTSCLNCATRCATSVRVVDERAVKVMGNPLSTLSDGEVCPRSHIALQVLYDEHRIATPLKRTNPAKGRDEDPGWQPVSWESALDEVAGRLRQIRGDGRPEQLLLLRGLNSRSDDDLIERFAAAYGTPNNVTDERAWGKIRGENPLRAKVVVVDPRYSVTAAKADRWLPINPGTDAALALALANVIINEKLYDSAFVTQWTEGFEQYREAADRYSPDKAAVITGILAGDIAQLAREFAATRPGIAWVGTGASRWPGGSYTSYAIYCLNALVGNIDVPGGVVFPPLPPYRSMPELAADAVAAMGLKQTRLDLANAALVKTPAVAVNRVADAINDGMPYPVAAAIGINANYLMESPGTERWAEALAKLPFYVHIGPFGNEMSQYADLLLPAATFLESWAYDHSPPAGGINEVKLKQPVVAARGEARSVGDIIFALTREFGGSVAAAFAGIGDGAEGFVRYRTAGMTDWSRFKEQGVWRGEDYRYRRYDRIFQTASGKFEFASANAMRTYGAANSALFRDVSAAPRYLAPEFLGGEIEYPLKLVSYQPLLDLENGGQNYPWAQQNYLIMAGRGWNNFVDISHQAARRYRVKAGDEVWVESPTGRIKAPVRIIAGIHPEVVAIARGQGHYHNGPWADGLGVNPNDITGVVYDDYSGQSAIYNTRVKIYRA